MKIKSWTYPLLMGFLLMFINSCENDIEQVFLPDLATSTITSITQTAAISGGDISASEGAPVTARGICWSTSTKPTTDDDKTSNKTGTGSYISTISGLEPGTTYYVRAYATNSAGTAYGNELTFTTATGQAPVLTTTSVGTISQTSATCGGIISSERGASITERGVCWSTTATPTTANSKLSSGAGLGGFACGITGLTAATTYYVRAYAINSFGTGYGEIRSFTTSVAVAAILETTAPTDINYTSATTGGYISLSGGTPVTARGICWSKTNAVPTIADTKTSDGTGTGSFSTSLTGLTAATTYYVRAYATTSVGTSYGEARTFATTTPTIPVLSTTAAISAILSSTATSGGTITTEMGAPVTDRGICWNTDVAPTISNSKISCGSGLGSFTGNLTGLLGSTKYYVRAYATNSAGTGYGPQLVFTTAAPVLSTVTTNAVTSIAKTTATSGGNVTNSGGLAITERGVCFSATNTTPTTTAGTKLATGTGTGTFTSNLTGLTANTTYYLRAYSISDIGISYGSVVTFKTLP